MNGPTVIALGFFDGIHRGHAALLNKTRQRAAEYGAVSAAFTFDRAPKEAVSGVRVALINSVEDRKWLIESLHGIERTIVAPFDHAMMTMPWEDFITKLLVDKYHAVHLVAGHDFHFGYKNQGTPELLRKKCAQLGIGCDIIPVVTLDGVTCSSTHIRALLQSGEVERAEQFLGHPHILSQTVRHGRHIGRTIGIPTVNLTMDDHVLAPAFGVYITRVILPDGTRCMGVTNVGVRPTVQNGEDVTVETFLLDFDGDLYAQRIRLEFCRRLRGEIRFDSLLALREQIRRDTQSARDYFEKEGHSL